MAEASRPAAMAAIADAAARRCSELTLRVPRHRRISRLRLRLSALRRRRPFIGRGFLCSTVVHWLVVDEQSSPAARRADLAERLEQALSDPLAGHLHQTQRRDLGDLVLGPVPSEALDETPHAPGHGCSRAPCR